MPMMLLNSAIDKHKYQLVLNISSNNHSCNDNIDYHQMTVYTPNLQCQESHEYMIPK